MTVKGYLTTKGLEEYLEKLVQAGQDVDAAAARALEAGGEIAVESMQAKVAVLTGNLKDSISMSAPQRDGNFHFVEIGLLKGTDSETMRYGNVQEFGSSKMPAHPYVRPTFDEKKSAIRAAMRKSLEEDGKL